VTFKVESLGETACFVACVEVTDSLLAGVPETTEVSV
jgi:hypothetical protein